MDTHYLPLNIYILDWEEYQRLKREHRIKHGELTKYMRLQFRAFLENHARNRAYPNSKEKPSITSETNINQEYINKKLNDTSDINQEYANKKLNEEPLTNSNERGSNVDIS